MSDNDRTRTERGFAIYDEIETSYGHTVRIQESSAAMAPHCWLFVGDSELSPGTHSPHLTVDQATRLRDALTAFIDDSNGGEDFPSPRYPDIRPGSSETETPRSPEPDVRQVLIPPGLWDVTELFFLRAGFILGRVPYLEDDLPTYSLARGVPEDLVEQMLVVRRRVNDAMAEADAVRETNQEQP